ncbi:MAG: thiolase family protein [Rhodospirillales bacterium]
MSPALITAYCRSPFTPAVRGGLASVRPDDLAAATVKALVERSGIDPTLIEDLIVGCAFPEGEQGLNIGRMVGFLADLPESMGGVTVNRFCGSSMQAVHMAAGSIALGAGEAFIAAGVESMTRVPLSGFNPLLHPGLGERYPNAYCTMGETAENVASRFGISRDRQDAFALGSQHKAMTAEREGRLTEERVAIPLGNRRIDQDECPRPNSTLDALAALPPAFDQAGSVTAGTSSPITDGAAAVLVCSEAFAKHHGLEPLAAIRSVAVSGCAPEIMGMGPVEASRKALQRAGLTVADLDVVELNEAFAAQSLACIDALKLDADRVNIDGGALALGHPLGATGARIVGKAAQLLHRNGGRFALATQCIGGGQGIATVLEGLG